MIVTFEPWEYIHAVNIGVQRFVANWNVPNKPSYTTGNNQSELLASPAAALAEAAVAKALNRPWTGHVWDHRDHNKYKHLPDVYPNIEVRRLRDRNNPVSVWKKDTGRGQILVVTYPVPPEFREVEILGWLPIDIAWENGEEKYGRRVFPTNRLRKIESLIKENR